MSRPPCRINVTSNLLVKHRTAPATTNNSEPNLTQETSRQTPSTPTQSEIFKCLKLRKTESQLIRVPTSRIWQELYWVWQTEMTQNTGKRNSTETHLPKSNTVRAPGSDSAVPKQPVVCASVLQEGVVSSVS